MKLELKLPTSFVLERLSICRI